MKIINGRLGEPSQNRAGTTFTGDVWFESVLPTTDGTTVNTVTFLPASRTHWHSHEGGQLLQVVQGEGLVCSEGAPPVVIRPGDTVWVPADERHWHGAGPNSLLTHVSISLGATSWEHEVSDQEYRAVPDDKAATEKESG
jgi:quercetin dioxygenase-like cupin family protein